MREVSENLSEDLREVRKDTQERSWAALGRRDSRCRSVEKLQAILEVGQGVVGGGGGWVGWVGGRGHSRWSVTEKSWNQLSPSVLIHIDGKLHFHVHLFLHSGLTLQPQNRAPVLHCRMCSCLSH